MEKTNLEWFILASIQNNEHAKVVHMIKLWLRVQIETIKIAGGLLGCGVVSAASQNRSQVMLWSWSWIENGYLLLSLISTYI